MNKMLILITSLLLVNLTNDIWAGTSNGRTNSPSNKSQTSGRNPSSKSPEKVSLKFDEEVIETAADQLTVVQTKKDTKSSKLYSKEYHFKKQTQQLLKEIGESQ